MGSSRSYISLPFLGLGLCTQTHIFVLGQHSENDGLVAVWTALCPAAAVELVDIQLAEVHGQLTELALARVLLDFLGLLVHSVFMLLHLRSWDGFLTFRANDQEAQAVGLVEGEVGRGHISFAVLAHLEVSLHSPFHRRISVKFPFLHTRKQN